MGAPCLVEEGGQEEVQLLADAVIHRRHQCLVRETGRATIATVWQGLCLLCEAAKTSLSSMLVTRHSVVLILIQLLHIFGSEGLSKRYHLS